MPTEIIAALVGALVGAWITYRFTLALVRTQFDDAERLANAQRRHEASAKFRIAFYDELAILCDWNNSINPEDILRNAFNKHFIAILEFANFLCETDRNTFISEWNQHYQDEHMSHKYYPDFSKYSTLGVSISRAKEIRETTIKNIEHLLSYAGHV